MRAVIFTPDRNQHGKKDYTGAFLPEARSFAKASDVSRDWIVPIDVSKSRARRRKEVIDGISDAAQQQGGLDCVAFFCHGYATGIQLGFNVRQAKQLGKAIAAGAGHDFVNVPLYACSSASSKVRSSVGGDGGFCDELRDAICVGGATFCRVMGHTTVGHTTKNPHVRFFEGSGLEKGGTGGFWVVRPGGPLWKKWRTALRSGTFRFAFPFGDLDELRGAL